VSVVSGNGETDVAEGQALAALRRRVRWQAGLAERQRAGLSVEPIDYLDPGALARRIAEFSDARRRREWSAFLVEMRAWCSDRGRLPATLEPLMRAVFAELT
jgi:hypothetical protein